MKSLSRLLKIRFFNGRWPWCSNRSTSRTFWTARTGFGPVGRRTRRWRSGETSSWRFGGGWVIELDVQRFFDTLDKAQLRTFLRRRVRDGVLLRLIGKWLNAGVLEDGTVRYPEAGTPQGGVLHPCWRTSFCTKCWTCGSSRTSSRG